MADTIPFGSSSNQMQSTSQAPSTIPFGTSQPTNTPTSNDIFGLYPSGQSQQSLSESIWNNINKIGTTMVKTGIPGVAPLGAGISAVSGLGNYANDVKSAFQGGQQQLKEGVSDINNANSPVDGLTSGLKAESGVASMISSPIAPLLKPLGDAVNAAGEGINMIPGATNFLNKNGDAIQKVAEPLANAGNVTGTILGIDQVAKAAPKFLQDTQNTVSSAIQNQRQARMQSTIEKANQVTGRIIQGTSEDVAHAQNALRTVDVNGVKTYGDLYTVLNDQVNALAKAQDNYFEQNQGSPKPLSDTTLSSKVGDSTVSHNYVQDAIDQLKAHYQAINDPTSLEKINQLEAKGNSEGLTVKDINDLARLHGQELNAFNANGQAASGLAKQAAENTRSGLKATAREMFNDPVYKSTDTTMSDVIRTRDLVEKVADKVTQLQQKIQPRSLGEKVGRLAGAVINVMGMNTPKGLIEYFLGRGTGLKTLNALDLEASLSKNLKFLNGALDPNASSATITNNLQSILNAANKTLNDKNIQPGLSMKNVGPDPMKVAQNIGGNDIKLIQDFMEKPDSLTTYMKLQPLLESEKLTDMPIGKLHDFFQNVVDQRNAPNFKVSSNQSKNGKSL